MTDESALEAQTSMTRRHHSATSVFAPPFGAQRRVRMQEAPSNSPPTLKQRQPLLSQSSKPATHLMAKRDVSGERRPQSSHLNCIGLLFEEDWFLHKVLGCLLDDGLQEYRRVCRQWDAVCKSLPVKLRQVPPEHVSDVLTAFPNAVELSCSTSFPSEDLDVARRLAGLTSMTRLERLDYFGDGTDGDLQLIHSETYSRLHSLGVHLGTAESYEGFRSVLLSLTGLKRLDVTLRSDVESSSWTPLTELDGLCEVSLSGSLLRNGSNQIMFPSTMLTKLTVNDSGLRCASVIDVSCPSQPVPLSLTALLSSGCFPLRWHCPDFESASEAALSSRDNVGAAAALRSPGGAQAVGA